MARLRLNTSLDKTPAMVNLARSVLSKASALAEVWGWRPESSNLCRYVKPYKLEKRKRYLSPRELGRLSEVLAEEERTQAELPQAIAAIPLLILTGCRVGEILALR